MALESTRMPLKTIQGDYGATIPNKIDLQNALLLGRLARFVRQSPTTSQRKGGGFRLPHLFALVDLSTIGKLSAPLQSIARYCPPSPVESSPCRLPPMTRDQRGNGRMRLPLPPRPSCQCAPLVGQSQAKRGAIPRPNGSESESNLFLFSWRSHDAPIPAGMSMGHLCGVRENTTRPNATQENSAQLNTMTPT